MTMNLLWKMVLKNFKNLSKIIVPFIIASGLMFGLEYIMVSILKNEYIRTRHAELPQVLSFANVLVALLVVVFIIYANRFVMKQRKQEFALNMILGMEKKHIRMILLLESLLEFVVISFISVIGGYLFGNLVFRLLNILIKDTGTTVMDYPFDIGAAFITILTIAFVLLVLLILNNINLSIQSPVQLMRRQKAGEKRPKQWLVILFTLLGLALLSYAYFIALTTEGSISSIKVIFIAVLIVTIATYLLFMSFTIVVLQLMKRTPSLYYKPNNFVAISGMLSRMRANAVGLASIAMLCTFLVVTLGMSLTTYRGMENQVKNIQQQDYTVTAYGNLEEKDRLDKDLVAFERDIVKYAQVDKFRHSFTTMQEWYKDGNEFIKYTDQKKQNNISQVIFTLITTEESYNAQHDASLHLKKGEIAVSTNAHRLKDLNDVTIAGVKANILKINENKIPSSLGADSLLVVVKDVEAFKKLATYYDNSNELGNSDGGIYIENVVSFNTENKQAIDKNIDRVGKEHHVVVQSREGYKKLLYTLNGGLIFIGIVVSIILLAGMFLILYYKQLAEGYEDKKNYQIMTQIGLPKSLIKKTINKQIFWIFALPILTAVIHTAFASKIIYQLLTLLAIREVSLFVTSYVAVAISVIIVYGIMYLLTSRAYFKLVNTNEK